MNAAVRTELRKLRWTRSLWALPVVGILVSAAATVVLMGWIPVDELPTRLPEHGSLRFGATNLGLLLLLFGIRVMGDESHHGTLAPTFVVEPDRRRVLAAKAAVVAAVAAVTCLVVDLAVVVTTAVAVVQRDLPMDRAPASTAALMGRSGLAMVLLALLGVAIGTAVRNRAAALVGTIAVLALGEPIIGGITKAPELLPGAVVRGLVTDGSSPGDLDALPAAGVLLGHLAVAGVAAALSLRRDVD